MTNEQAKNWKEELNEQFFAGIPMEDMGSNQVEDHQHRWEIDKLAGFIKTGIEGVYIICRSCGEVRLVEVNKPTLTNPPLNQ